MPERSPKGFAQLPQAERFHAPLQPGDTATISLGCRHTNLEICRKHSMLHVCAFVRRDGMCHKPPASWPKRYTALKNKSGPDG